jgi:hypothetical protein
MRRAKDPLGEGEQRRLADALARGARLASPRSKDQDCILRPSLADGIHAVDLRALALTLGDLS